MASVTALTVEEEKYVNASRTNCVKIGTPEAELNIWLPYCSWFPRNRSAKEARTADYFMHASGERRTSTCPFQVKWSRSKRDTVRPDQEQLGEAWKISGLKGVLKVVFLNFVSSFFNLRHK